MKITIGYALAAALVLSAPCAEAAPFTMEQVLSYPYAGGLVAAPSGGHVGWVRNVAGVRNVWVADAPAYKAHVVTSFKEDDGQEITQLSFSADGKWLLFVRGGDHDANWEGEVAPVPDARPEQQKVTIWAVAPKGGKAAVLAEGDAPTISRQDEVAFVVKDQVWSVRLGSKAKPALLFFDRGKDRDLTWSPDGARLAFRSDRGDHSFIGIFGGRSKPLVYIAPTTSRDLSPRWSPDGRRIAFVRLPGEGGAPVPILKLTPDPWAIWVADASSGVAHPAWTSPETLHGSFPRTEGNANLNWVGGKLVFLADLDNWPHLYAVAAGGGAIRLLTPGPFMVEHVNVSRDGQYLVYSANTGSTRDDGDRRHIFRVGVDGGAPFAVTAGESIEWEPVAADASHVAFISTGARRPPVAAIAGIDGKQRRDLLADDVPAAYPSQAFVLPRSVSFRAADGTLAHGQVFQSPESGAAKPGVIFVHGGPPRQMLLGWHYMDYYSNAYAVNQYLATHGFTVLAVNYRLGIGYGHDFANPEHAGPTGASEYQDVVAGAKLLQALKGVDAAHIGIWGGSYGGYLTAMGLARDPEIFKAGVDLHGVHDWSRFLDVWFRPASARYEKGDRDQALKVAFLSSPIADLSKWKGPVLLIHGDDDRNVQFEQTVDLARRLDARHLHYDELILPDEIHGFLRHASWLRADTATSAYLAESLAARP
ncbi:MAG: S9 family peptidase [Alphaproteobacteria bacterium]|nr:S9 family peptidase [Alphaproteobacteria bacterium]MBV9692393.1 S9 family peptidase [Alphaproteobacteria bacterium]